MRPYATVFGVEEYESDCSLHKQRTSTYFSNSSASCGSVRRLPRAACSMTRERNSHRSRAIPPLRALVSLYISNSIAPQHAASSKLGLRYPAVHPSPVRLPRSAFPRRRSRSRLGCDCTRGTGSFMFDLAQSEAGRHTGPLPVATGGRGGKGGGRRSGNSQNRTAISSRHPSYDRH